MKRALVALTLSLMVAGCGLDEQTVPSLTGPSELGLSLSVTASPDAILQDGAAQSVIEIVARDASGQPVPGKAFLVQSRAGNTLKVGTLSVTSVTTNSQGRGSVLFTAPALGAGFFSLVTIDFIQIGTNADFSVVQSVSVRMVR